MKTYAVVGYPCKHSLSPLIYNAAFQALRIDAEFVIFETRDLSEFVEKIRKGEVAGGSVTMPYKSAIINYLDWLSEDVKKIGACNCVRGLCGFNTDFTGALRALPKRMGKRIYLIGAGGAGKAILYGLKDADVTVFNRTPNPGVKPLTKLDPNFDILINASSCGFKSDESCVPAEILGPGKIVMDIVYEPLETRLIKDAKKAGCETITGEEMLLCQAAKAFEIWTAQKAPLDVMRNALYSFFKKSAPA